MGGSRLPPNIGFASLKISSPQVSSVVALLCLFLLHFLLISILHLGLSPIHCLLPPLTLRVNFKYCRMQVAALLNGVLVVALAYTSFSLATEGQVSRSYTLCHL